MNAVMGIHIAGGLVALAAGAAAVAARKGGAVHGSAGTCFCVSMLVLGLTASALEPFRDPPGSPVGGIIVCYFVATGWVTARRREGAAGRFEKLAAAFALLGGALILWGALTGATTPSGPGPVFAFAFLCLLAGLGDLNFVLRGRLAPARRLARHVWRICFAFFIATGSFFLGQQDLLPTAVQGTPVLFVLAFAPFAVMLFWLARLRFAKTIARSSRSGLMTFRRRPQPEA